jgi:dipeptidyl aminopeptidase
MSRYYTAAYPSIDRHVYAEILPSSDNLADFKPNPIALTDSAVPGYYEVSFSPGARYYVLSYRGPKVPWQRLLEATAVEGMFTFDLWILRGTSLTIR